MKLGFQRIVVVPYFCFQEFWGAASVSTPTGRQRPPRSGLSLRQLPRPTPLVVDTFKERVEDVLRGDTAMNCSYANTAQVLGFEQDVGRAQESHHHHVEGLAESCTLCEQECTGACQPDGVPIPHQHHHHDHAGEQHHHHPLPPCRPPMGPRSLGSKDFLRSLKRSAVFCVSIAAVLGNDILDKAKISFSDQSNPQRRFHIFLHSFGNIFTASSDEVLAHLKAVDFAASAPTG